MFWFYSKYRVVIWILFSLFLVAADLIMRLYIGYDGFPSPDLLRLLEYFLTLVISLLYVGAICLELNTAVLLVLAMLSANYVSEAIDLFVRGQTTVCFLVKIPFWDIGFKFAFSDLYLVVALASSTIGLAYWKGQEKQKQKQKI